MRKRLFWFCAALLAGIGITCTMDPLFFDISREYPPIEPDIKGAPSKIVELNNTLYAANREQIYSFDVSGMPEMKWENLGNPLGGNIRSMAATSNNVYALNEDGKIYQLSGGAWHLVLTVGGAQQIYGANTYLFVGNGSSVSVYDESNLSNSIALTGAGGNIPGGLLTGAVYDGSDYYITTSHVRSGDNTGVFQLAGTAWTKKYSGSMKGIIANGTTIYAVSDKGIVVNDAGTEKVNTGLSLSGALAWWPNTASPTMLLIGLSRSSGVSGYGYRELEISGGGTLSGPYVPGDDAGGRSTSIDPKLRETSAIAKHAVNALWVVPVNSPPGDSSHDSAGRPVIFASTQQNGVWSYRTRRGEPQWNGEDGGGF
jgi:hypothetical protein